MIEATDAWAGIGSTIVGGVIGGLLGAGAVVIGVLLAQRFTNKSARSAERLEASGKTILDVMRLRDQVARAKVGATGSFDIWPLREELYLRWHVLKDEPACQEAWEFYEAVKNFRTWARGNPTGLTVPDVSKTLRAELDAYGTALIKMLQTLAPRLEGQGRPGALIANVEPEEAHGT